MSGSARTATAIRYLDLVVLAIALPVFLVAELPLLGYVVMAAVWLAQLAIEAMAERSAERQLTEGNRRGAMGRIGFAVMGRVWLITLAVLLIGVLGDREAGLAAALLAVVLFTVHFAARFVARAMEPGEAV